MKLTVGYFQFEPRFGDVSHNMGTIRSALDGVRFDLLVLPELCTTGYQFADRKELVDLAEPANGNFVGVLAELAETASGVIVAGFAERDGDDLYNAACTVTPSGDRHVYRKVHLFDREKELFKQGDTPFRSIHVGWDVPLGVMICFDWIFPEAMRALALDGARIVAHPANLVMPYCQRAMFARAVENRSFVITANRFGTEVRGGLGPLVFTGGSQVMSPDGTTLVQAAEQETALHVVEIETGEADFQLNQRNNLANDRRPEMY